MASILSIIIEKIYKWLGLLCLILVAAVAVPAVSADRAEARPVIEMTRVKAIARNTTRLKCYSQEMSIEIGYKVRYCATWSIDQCHRQSLMQPDVGMCEGHTTVLDKRYPKLMLLCDGLIIVTKRPNGRYIKHRVWWGCGWHKWAA